MARSQFYTIEQISRKQSLTPEGFLLCEEVPIARTGMMVYGPDETPISAGPDGIVRIFREEEEVFRPETIASALGKPVTHDHPDDDVTPKSWRELAHGFATNIRRGEGAMDDLLLADLVITTTEGIEAVKSGKREISMGYDADYEEVQPGVGKQSNIIFNHVALVDQGRCGPRCAIRDKQPEKKMSKLGSIIRRAFKAKDEAELEALEKEAKDELVEPEKGEEKGDTHVHIHQGGVGKPEDEVEGRGKFTDDDLEQFMAKNDAEHAEIFKRLEALEKGGRGVEEEEEEFMDEISQEVPEEKREDVAKARDSVFMKSAFQNAVAMAEILAPGVKIPTFDSAKSPKKTFKSLCKLRRKALDSAYANSETRPLLAQLLNNKPLDTNRMSCGAIRTLFESASSLRSFQNTRDRVSHLDVSKGKKGPMTLAELNKLNAEKYGK